MPFNLFVPLKKIVFFVSGYFNIIEVPKVDTYYYCSFYSKLNDFPKSYQNKHYLNFGNAFNKSHF